ncbi:hypothetical protein BDZ45DRAFT_436793 [Acephala macrosclerotiorum]|nr:hypothetical protein BDZ45DRAFT_436793 [Acephala macrosclerotiorum]
MRSLTAITLLSTFANAYKTFETVCTKPTEVVNYVSSADTRSTLDILWSCLLTIVACTWSVQHLNVPEQRDGRDQGWMGDIKWTMKRSWTSTKWMLATVIAPEYLLMKNWGDLVLAKENLFQLHQLAAEDNVPWSLSHTLFADMGGFVIRSYAFERLKKPSESGTDTTDLKSKYANPFYISALDLRRLRQEKLLERLPYISIDELLDRSKGDNFVRLIAVLQILWMVVQIIARGFRHLAVSQLEIGVIAFAACAVLIYAINWSKPKGVQSPVPILQYEGEIPDEVINCLGQTARENFFSLSISSSWNHQRGSRIRNDSLYDELASYDDHDSRHVWAGFIGTLVFGGIHLAAWNFEFPTHVEQILWRYASVTCTCLFVAIFFLSLLHDLLKHLGTGISLHIQTCIVGFSMFIYVVARLVLLVELFRTLCFLPPSAYISTWAANIPHLY